MTDKFYQSLQSQTLANSLTAPATESSDMSSSNSSPPDQIKPVIEPTLVPESPVSITSIQESANGSSNTMSGETHENLEDNAILSEKESEESIKEGVDDEEGEEEEEGECGFCLFMKGGGCKDSFVEWEKCVEEGEKSQEDIVEKCFQTTAALKKCMEEHSDYYAPLLQAEKAAEAEVMKQLEEEKVESSNEQEGDAADLGTKAKEEALDGSKRKEES